MKKNLNIAYLNGSDIGKKVINVTETINNQDKYIEITENGSVEVVADSGYTGLGKVTVNVEVASSGGGSGSGESGEASTIEYLDLRNYSGTAFGVAVNAKSLLFKFNSNLFKGDSESAPVYQIYVVGDVFEGGYTVMQALLMGSDFVGIDFSLKTNGKGELKTTAQQIIEDQGITKEQLDAIPRITKEQFYSLE